MERYQELFYLHVLSGELSKNVSLYYHIGHFIWLLRRGINACTVILTF